MHAFAPEDRHEEIVERIKFRLENSDNPTDKAVLQAMLDGGLPVKQAIEMLHNDRHEHSLQVYLDLYDHKPNWAAHRILRTIEAQQGYGDPEEVDDFIVQFITDDKVGKAVQEGNKVLLHRFTALKKMVSDGTKRDSIKLQSMIENREEEKAPEAPRPKPKPKPKRRPSGVERAAGEETKEEEEPLPLASDFRANVLESLRSLT
jgi:hypothetical protein